jgi:xylose isomerase
MGAVRRTAVSSPLSGHGFEHEIATAFSLGLFDRRT